MASLVLQRVWHQLDRPIESAEAISRERMERLQQQMMDRYLANLERERRMMEPTAPYLQPYYDPEAIQRDRAMNAAEAMGLSIRWNRGDGFSVNADGIPAPPAIEERYEIPRLPPMPATAVLDAPDMSDPKFQELRDYQRRCEKVGYHCAEVEGKVLETELKAFLAEEMLPVYDYQSVKRYMDALVGRLNAEEERKSTFTTRGKEHHWRWAPLRDCDKKADKLVPRYTKTIPEPVLMTVEKVVEKFGEQVCLEVSDIYTVPRPDPFLAVSAPGSHNKFVIERWDEPGFRR